MCDAFFRVVNYVLVKNPPSAFLQVNCPACETVSNTPGSETNIATFAATQAQPQGCTSDDDCDPAYITAVDTASRAHATDDSRSRRMPCLPSAAKFGSFVTSFFLAKES